MSVPNSVANYDSYYKADSNYLGLTDDTNFGHWESSMILTLGLLLKKPDSLVRQKLLDCFLSLIREVSLKTMEAIDVIPWYKKE